VEPPLGVYLCMGHVRLGRPPASKKWREIVDYLAEAEVSAAELADAVAGASEKSLARATKDPAFIEALWLLLKVPQAAKSERFVEALRELGVSVPDNPSVTDVVVGMDAAVHAAQRHHAPDVTDLSEMAKNAAVAALHGVTRERLPALWEPNREDERTTIATFAAPDKFGELCQRFFTNLVEHNLQYFLDRETPKHIGPGRMAQSVGDLARFDRDIRRHCEETTIIMRAFAKDWLGHNAYHLGKDISRADTTGFAHVALQKIRNELSIRSRPNEDL
jgi:hypothetical protein